jgi:hypothetical protein
MKTTLLRFSFIALALLFSACSDDDGPATQNGGNGNGELYLRLNMDGNSEIDVTGSIGEFDESPILASLTTEANGGLDPNTVQVSGGIINEEGTGHTKIMSIVLKDITAPGTYDLVAQDGMFNYSVGDSNGSPIAGYYIGSAEDGSCSVTITEISNEVRPGIGKPIKGSFTATYINAVSGEETIFEGEFNGGVAE